MACAYLHVFECMAVQHFDMFRDGVQDDSVDEVNTEDGLAVEKISKIKQVCRCNKNAE